jgi:hypothetical protein
MPEITYFSLDERMNAMAIMLKKEVIVDEWWVMIENSGDKVEQVFKDTEYNIKKSEAPDVTFERVKVSSSFLGGIMGNDRDFLLVKDKHLSKFDMYIGVRKYGTHLDLVWYLTQKPNIIMQIINLILSYFKKTIVLNLSLFDEHDLRVYATVIHHSFLEAVEKVKKPEQQFDRTSKGFLGIS